MRASSSTAYVALLDRSEDALERLHGGLALAQLNVRDAREELRLDVVLALAVDLFEESQSLRVLPVPILVPAEQIVQLPVELPLFLVIEASNLTLVVLANALDDVSGLGKVGRELGQPQQRLAVLDWDGLSAISLKME